MILKAPFAHIIKTEQSFPYLRHNNFSFHFHCLFFCMRTVAKKAYNISVLNHNQALNLLMEHLVFNRIAAVKLLHSNDLVLQDAL